MDSPYPSLGIVIFVALVLLNAIIALAHSALINARKQQLRELAEDGNAAAKRLLMLVDNSTRLLASRQFVSIFLHFFAAGVLTAYDAAPFTQFIVAQPGLAIDPRLASTLIYIAIWLISAVLMILFGERIPDVIASSNPERLALLLLRPMQVILAITAPVTRIMLWISSRLAKPFGRAGMSYVTEEEIKTLVDAGSEEGVIEDEEKEMIYSIFQFGDKVAREIMVPRIDITALPADATTRIAIDMTLKAGHSRIPIYEETIDKVIGLIYAKDLLRAIGGGQSQDKMVREIMRPAYFVPESKRAGDLLEELQQRKIHMAIVIDEYGGTAGLVTIEDLLEEIVGDIQDEYDPEEEADFERISDDEYVFDAGINLNEVNEMMDVELPTDESDTLGGFVLSTLGKVPLAGETFKQDNLEIKVESITGRRIRKVRVTRLPEVSDTSTAEKASEEGEETASKSIEVEASSASSTGTISSTTNGLESKNEK
ncbi:MAG: hemolysin family protein [Anaerolineae bacterium]|nr:HlyC/CorC family transporter [Anaerolineae bacterium]